MVIFSLAMVADFPNETQSILILSGFLVVFWGVGIGMLVGAIYMGTQSAMIGVRDGSLFVERKTMFGVHWTDFEPGRISRIEVGSSNMSVNDVPIMQLNITPVEEDSVGLFAQLSNEELQWLAQQLNKDLGLNPESASAHLASYDLSQTLAPPANSKVTVRQTNDQKTQISIPPLSVAVTYVTVLSMLAFGAVFFAIVVFNVGFGFELIPVGLFLLTIIPTVVTLTLVYRTRRFEIFVSEDRLEIQRYGVFSRHHFQATKPNIVDIDVVDSGIKTNGKTDMMLMVDAGKENKFSLMTSRDVAEIAYVAALMRQRLQFSNEPANSEA